LIHTEHSAGYPWQVVVTSNQREKFELPAADEPTVLAKMWLTEEAGKKLATLGGEDLDALRATAEKRDFRPKPLRARLGFSFTNTIRKVESANVIGVLPGADPELAREAVRTGRGLSPTISGGDPNQRPIVLQPGEGSTRVGIQTGKPPRTGTGYPEDTPHGPVWKPDRRRMFSKSIADKMPTRSTARLYGDTWARTHSAHPPLRLSNNSAKRLKKATTCVNRMASSCW
jgi:hypothetical protein